MTGPAVALDNPDPVRLVGFLADDHDSSIKRGLGFVLARYVDPGLLLSYQ